MYECDIFPKTFYAVMNHNLVMESTLPEENASVKVSIITKLVIVLFHRL